VIVGRSSFRVAALSAATGFGIMAQVALACSPPSSGREPTAKQIIFSARKHFSDAENIVDALVIDNGIMSGKAMVRVIRTWKGRHAQRLPVYFSGCGQNIPRNGHKVRLLLVLASDEMLPLQELQSICHPKLYAQEVDRLLKSRRDRTYESLGAEYPPPPGGGRYCS
jgi:hypothetical protein